MVGGYDLVNHVPDSCIVGCMSACDQQAGSEQLMASKWSQNSKSGVFASKFVLFLLEYASSSLTSAQSHHFRKESNSGDKPWVSGPKGSLPVSGAYLGWGGGHDWYQWNEHRCVRLCLGIVSKPSRWGLEEQQIHPSSKLYSKQRLLGR